MTDKKPTLKLWSVVKGEMADFEFSIENGDIIAECDGEFVKFPGGITKDELKKLVDAHNEANEGVKALSAEDIQVEEDLAEANQRLLDSL